MPFTFEFHVRCLLPQVKLETFARSIFPDAFATVFLAMSVDVAVPAGWFGTVLHLIISLGLASIYIVTIVTSTSRWSTTRSTTALSSAALIIAAVWVVGAITLDLIDVVVFCFYG